MMYSEVDKELSAEMHHLVFNLRSKNYLSNDSVLSILPHSIRIERIIRINRQEFSFRDTLLFDAFMNRFQSYRILVYQTEIHKQAVKVSISKSLAISDDLIEKVAISIFTLTLLFLLCIFLFNRYFLSRVWSDFFHTIDVIRNYDLQKSKELNISESEITEFNLLNIVFDKMIDRIKQDYLGLKEFTENISHEIQTPLAIIKAKIDLLLQNETLDENQINLILSMQTSAIRLSNLNKSLILLAKIDNNQFQEHEKISIKESIEFHLNNFEEIIETKNIKLSKSYKENVEVVADSNLINILIINLLKNAIRHNLPSGILDIVLENNKLTIGNSGSENNVAVEELFKRFIKASSKPESLGLGLAIIKKICDYYRFSIQYSYKDKYHKIEVLF